jgi:hypothetical protein
MAPEQLAGDPAADHRVDIYAVGLLGYELLTGEAPFKAPSPQETMAAQLTRVPEPISKTRPDVPAPLATLLSRCLAKQPADRPQTAAEVAALLADMEVSSGSSAALRGRARATGWIAASAGALALAIVAFAWFNGRGSPVNRDVAPVPDTTPPLPRAAAALTREDSVAIARAVQQRVAREQAATRARVDSARARAPAGAPAAPAAAPMSATDVQLQMSRMAESLRAEIEKAVLDSVSRLRTQPRDISAIIRGAAGLDSLARGRAFRPLLEAEQRRGPVSPHELSKEAFVDRLANLGPPRRIFISFPTTGERTAMLSAPIDTLVDSLRRTIGRNPRYVLIDPDTVRATLQRTRTISSISRALDVELFASIGVSLYPDSSAMWTVTTRDLAAHSAYSSRSFGVRTPGPALGEAAYTIVGRVMRYLEEMDRAPRRTLLRQ